MSETRRQALHIDVPAKSQATIPHGESIVPDQLFLGNASAALMVQADAVNVVVHNPTDEPVKVNVLCIWYIENAAPNDWDRRIGPPSADSTWNIWENSQLWLLIDPEEKGLRSAAAQRRAQFTEEHIDEKTDLGLAMLALFDAANGQRGARNWAAVAKIVSLMDTLLRRED